MITREELDLVFYGTSSSDYAWKLIIDEQAKHQALIDAAVAHVLGLGVDGGLIKAVKPFLPPQKLSEELDRLADIDARVWVSKEKLHEMADKARDIEK